MPSGSPVAEISRLCCRSHGVPWCSRFILVESAHGWGSGPRSRAGSGLFFTCCASPGGPPAPTPVSTLEKPDSWEGRRGRTEGLPSGPLAGGHGDSSREVSSRRPHTPSPVGRERGREPGGSGLSLPTWPTLRTAGPQLLAGSPQPSRWSSQLTDQRNSSRGEHYHPDSLTGVASWGSDSGTCRIIPLPQPRFPPP